MTLIVNWGLVAERLLPVKLRIAFWVAWFRVLLKPLATLNDVFTSQINNSVYLLNFTAQTALLEWHLNNAFFRNDIVIRNQLNIADAAIVYDTALNINTPVVYSHADTYDAMIVYDVQPTLGVNFIVDVPTSLSGQEVQLRALINRYNHAGFRYSINYV